MIVDEENYLEHYGKKGMKWGVRRAQNRALNKASRAKDRQQHTKEVDAARERFKSGKARDEFKTAKAQFKKDKVTLGSREARKILNKTKQRNIEDYNKSQQARDGKEAVRNLLLVGGAVVAISALAR